MTRILLPALFYSLIATAQQPLTPNGPSGNWLKTDGSNRFVLGLFDGIACYKGDTWTISAIGREQDHWHYTLRNDSASAGLDISLKDPHTLVLTDHGQQQVLKDTKTYNYLYKPVQRSFTTPFFRPGITTLKGYLRLPPAAAKRALKDTYIEVSYENPLTGEKEYFLADLDSLGQFTIRFPVYKPQLCTLSYGEARLADFFVQPGDRLLIAVNKDILLSGSNPDYSQLMQRVCIMGDDEDFNNQYQHFLWYSSSLDDAVKKNYDRMITAIDQVYPSANVEQRFIDYIKEEVKYNYAYTLLHSLKIAYPDSLQKVYKMALEPGSPTALLHDSYYRMAGYYARNFMAPKNPLAYVYPLPYDKRNNRIMNEYGPLLPPGFLMDWLTDKI